MIEGVIYLVIQHSTVHEYDFTTSIDKIIPRMPEFVWIYHTLAPVVIFAHVFFMRKKRIFYTAIISFIIALVLLNSCFLLLPSEYPRSTLEPTTMSERLLSWTYSVDAANNTFPSTHIAFAWLVFLNVCRSGFSQNKGVVIGHGVWATLIVTSTLVLKQHNIVDVISGMGLAVLAVWLAQKAYDKLTPNVALASTNYESY